MGTRGPVPKRSDQRAGHRSKAETPDRIECGGDVLVPAPDPQWHPRALETYLDFANSGQTRYWEPSDWRMLVIACDNLTSHYTNARPSAEMFKHTLGILSSLGATEADRRRSRIEVDRKGTTEDESTAGGDDIEDRFAKLAAADGNG